VKHVMARNEVTKQSHEIATVSLGDLAMIFFLLFLSISSPSHALISKDDPPEKTIQYIDQLVSQKKPPNKEAIQSLVAALSDPDYSILVKERAAWAIGQLGLKDHTPSLREAAKHKSLLVRSAALDALLRLRADSGIPIYVNIAKNDPILVLRKKATLGLGLLRSEKSIKPVVDLSADEKEEIRGASVLAMAALHSSKNDFREVLKEMMKDQSAYVQQRAKVGLDIANKNFASVKTHLTSSDPDVRLVVALFYRTHGRESDLASVKKKKQEESDSEVQSELDSAIRAITKRVSEQKKNAGMEQVQSKSKK